MDTVLDVAQKLSGATLATLLLAILYGSYKNIWVWGRQYEKVITDYEARLDKSEKISEGWKNLALSAVGLAEKSTQLVKSQP